MPRPPAKSRDLETRRDPAQDAQGGPVLGDRDPDDIEMMNEIAPDGGVHFLSPPLSGEFGVNFSSPLVKVEPTEATRPTTSITTHSSADQPPAGDGAAPAQQQPATRSAGRLRQEALSRLRNARVDIQGLQALFARVRRGETDLLSNAAYLVEQRSQIGSEIHGVQGDDTVHHVQDIWHQIEKSPVLVDPGASYSPATLTQHLNLLDDLMRKLVLEIGYVTIPPRLEDWLKDAPVGHYVPFHEVFQDEVSNDEDRKAVLDYLSLSPQVARMGVIDRDTGLIYRCAERRWKRMLSILYLLGAAAVVTGIVAALAAWNPLTLTPAAGAEPLMTSFLVGWAALLAGILVHMGVDTSKRMQATKQRPPVLAMGDLPLIISARLGQIVFKLALALIGFFGVLVTAGVEMVTPFAMFLVGYSLDSFVDLFGASFEQQSQRQLSTLKGSEGPALEV